MRILFISSGSLNGKPSPIISNQASFLIKNGCEIDFYLIQSKGFVGYFTEIFKLRAFLRNKHYDVFHAHYGLSAIVSTLAGVRPLIVSLMGSDVHAGGWQKWLIKVFVKKRWAFTIAKSKELAEKVGENHCLVIPNGVDMETFYPISKDIAKQRLGLDLSKRYLFFAANPARSEKNFDLAKQAYDRIKSDELVLVKMENIPHNDVYLWINASDVTLLSSLWEGSPNVIKEAMACNRPIVSTNVGDVEWLFGNEPGLFIAGFNIDNYAEKLRNALIFSVTAGNTNGRNRLLSLGLDSRIVSEKIITIYKGLL
ncbi:D-inositol-3-phosphate glycosyltransferase [anaerobic digester metagenome]